MTKKLTIRQEFKKLKEKLKIQGSIKKDSCNMPYFESEELVIAGEGNSTRYTKEYFLDIKGKAEVGFKTFKELYNYFKGREI